MRSMPLSGCLLLAACTGAAIETDPPDSDAPADSANGDSSADSASDDTNGGDSDDINPACAEPTTGATQATVQIDVDGTPREYRVSVPEADAGVELPVLMAFHGGDGRNWPFPQEAQFEGLVEQHDAIAVYPLSELLPFNEGEWQLNTSDAFRQDIDFVEAILDELEASYCVDTGRVYATGYSLGSMFTYEVACHLSDRFAAIASFAGSMPVEPNACELSESVAIMHLHGARDGIISYGQEWDWKEWDYVGTMMDIPSLVAFWSQKNNCQSEEENTSPDAVHAVHSGCDGGVRVEHYRLNDVGHEWPNAIDGTSTHQVIWDFVSGFERP